MDNFTTEQEQAAMFRWLIGNLGRWSVARRGKAGKAPEYRMRDDDGDYWGEWWPTPEQAIRKAMQRPCEHQWKAIRQGQTYMDCKCDLCGAFKQFTWMTLSRRHPWPERED